jgi:hypothetical protein
MKKTDTTKAPKSLHREEIRPLAFYCSYTEKSLKEVRKNRTNRLEDIGKT